MKLPKTRNSPLAIICLMAITSCVGINLAFSAVHINEQGWTIITPSADSRLVYVSSSEGDNSNDGLSPETPKRTILAGNQLIRDGYPDHLLLKRGDVFEPENVSMLGAWKNGRSADEPIVLSYYGDSGPRPVIKVTNSLVNHNGGIRNYQAFIGIEVYKSNSDPHSPDFTNVDSSSVFRFVGGGRNLRIEDCRLRFMQVVIQGYQGGVYSDVMFRRNIVLDAWRHGTSTGRSEISGIFMSWVEGSYVFEENYFDHNGWNATVQGAGANAYNHNVYMQYSNVAGGIIRGNISVRASAHGWHGRSGGVMERNLFAYNAISANFGGVDHPRDPNVLTFNNRFVQNVILAGRRMNPNSGSQPQTTAVWGFVGAFVGDIDVIDNIIANRSDSGNNRAFHTDQQPVTLNLINNIVYQWNTNEDMNDPTWPYPDAGLGDYIETVTGTNSTEAFYEAHRNRGLGEYPWELTSYAAISYFRQGFNKSAVGGYYDYGNSNPIAATGVSLNVLARSIQGNDNFELVATVSPSEAHNQGVIWSSGDPTVASVNNFGIVTGHGPGSTTITATTIDGGFTATATVSVQVAATTSISVSPELINRLPAGSSAPLTATVTPAEADQNVTWSSADESIATVNENGLVTAIAEGMTTITVSTVDGNFSATANVITIGGPSDPDQWAGFDIESDYRVDSGYRFLSWVNIQDKPWIRCEDLGIWLYLPEAHVTAEGAWAYVVSTETFVRYEESSWFVAPPLQSWLQTTNNEGPQWVYFVNGN